MMLGPVETKVTLNEVTTAKPDIQTVPALPVPDAQPAKIEVPVVMQHEYTIRSWFMDYLPVLLMAGVAIYVVKSSK